MLNSKFKGTHKKVPSIVVWKENSSKDSLKNF